jgi:hypothetical protein
MSTEDLSRRSFVLVSLGSCLALSSGCGLLLYPERRGQRGGRLDWGVVLLDGLGLLLFLVPGIVAFVVDFATGTIYLPSEPYYVVPPESYGQMQPGPTEQTLVAQSVPRGQMTKQRIEEVVSSHVGRPVQLVDGRFQTERLHSLKDFWHALSRRISGTA